MPPTTDAASPSKHQSLGWQDQVPILDIGILCNDWDPLQQRLDDLYSYRDDISTKTYHRSRIALFQTLLGTLIEQQIVTKFDSAMDIGCNAGFYSKTISDHGFRDVLGIDINESYVAKAQAAFSLDTPKKRIAFKTMDATAISADKLYDFILCTEVIEHTSTPDKVIQSIMTLLTPGAVAVVSLPNSFSIGYLSSYLVALLKGRGVSPELRDHLRYPFYKGPRLFKDQGASILARAGVNCLFNDHLLLLLHRTPLFAPLVRLNFWLSRRWPFRCASQFYFFVVRKDQ